MSGGPGQSLAGAPPALRFTRFWWLAGWLMVLFITVSTLEPPQYVPNLHLNDKLEHATAFFGMTFWFGGLVRRRRYWLLALWMELFGAGIEIAQGTMGWGRDMDFWDWVADTVGVGLALALLLLAVPRAAGSWMRMVERLLGR